MWHKAFVPKLLNTAHWNSWFELLLIASYIMEHRKDSRPFWCHAKSVPEKLRLSRLLEFSPYDTDYITSLGNEWSSKKISAMCSITGENNRMEEVPKAFPSLLNPVHHFTVCSAMSHQDRTISFHHKVNLSHTRGEFRAKVPHPLQYRKVYHQRNKK